MNVQLIRHHIAYNCWANERLLAAVRQLTDEQLYRDFGTADKSVTGTLSHVCASERTWLGRIEEGAWRFSHRPTDFSMTTILDVWPGVLESWRRLADSLQDGDAERIIRYKDLRGQEWQQPLWQIILHAVNHSTHHRGQVSGFLRAMGVTPPPIDFILFVRQGGS